MKTAIRIKAEHYDVQTGNIISSQTVHDDKVSKPIDNMSLGYRHQEQIEIISSLQDFKLNPQLKLISEDLTCKKCGSNTFKYGVKTSNFHAVLTDHRVSIQRKKCLCGWLSPASVDGIYGSSFHPELLEKQAKQGAENSYRRASSNLNSEVPKERAANNIERLRKTINKASSVIENERLKDKEQVNKGKAAHQLIAVVDGGHIKSNVKGSRSFEAMIGSVFRPENLNVVDKHHNKISKKTSVASALNDKQVTIKKLLLNACLEEGMHKEITHLTCLTDGANNCWSITKTLTDHCKEIEQILDWFHITKRFTVINNSIDDAFIKRIEKVKWHLWHGNATTALIRIETLIDLIDDEKVTNLLTELYEYIDRNQKYLTCYQEKKDKGLPYTSTYAEVSVNSIINVRQKCNQKMQWGRQGAHNVLQLRASIFSNTWSDDWKNACKVIYKKAA